MKFFSSLSLLGCLPFSADTHIIFDDVGSLAGAVSYTHLAINVDFTSIRTASSKVSLALDNFEHKIAHHIIPDKPITTFDKVADLGKQYNHTFHQLMDNRRTKLRRLTDQLNKHPEVATCTLKQTRHRNQGHHRCCSNRKMNHRTRKEKSTD